MLLRSRAPSGCGGFRYRCDALPPPDWSVTEGPVPAFTNFSLGQATVDRGGWRAVVVRSGEDGVFVGDDELAVF